MEPVAAKGSFTKLEQVGRSWSETCGQGESFSLECRMWRRQTAVRLNCEHRTGQNSWGRRFSTKVYSITNAVLHPHPIEQSLFNCAAKEPDAVEGSRPTRNWQLPDTSTHLLRHIHNPTQKQPRHIRLRDGSCLILHFLFSASEWKREQEMEKTKKKFTWYLKTADSPAAVVRGSGVAPHFRKKESQPLMLLSDSHRGWSWDEYQ